MLDHSDLLLDRADLVLDQSHSLLHVSDYGLTAAQATAYQTSHGTSVIEEKVKPKEKNQTKNDPRLVAAARELKDRWLEQINSGECLPMGNGKYEVRRTIETDKSENLPSILELPLLAA